MIWSNSPTVIIAFSDTHFDGHASIRGNKANKEISEAIDVMIQQVELDYPHHQKLYIHAGDVFDNSNPTEEARILFRSKWDNRKIIVVGGNHDAPIIGSHPLTITSTHPYPGPISAVTDQPEMFIVNPDIKTRLLAIPHSHISNPSKLNNIHAMLDNSSKEWNTIVLTHGLIEGLSIHEKYKAMKSFDISEKEMIKLCRKCAMVVIGDYHKYTMLEDYGMPVIYPGSILAENFGEAKYDHGYLAIEATNTNKLTTVYKRIDDMRTIKEYVIGCDEDVLELEKMHFPAPSSIKLIITKRGLKVNKPSNVEIVVKEHRISKLRKSEKHDLYTIVGKESNCDNKIQRWLRDVKKLTEAETMETMETRKAILTPKEQKQSAPVPKYTPPSYKEKRTDTTTIGELPDDF